MQKFTNITTSEDETSLPSDAPLRIFLYSLIFICAVIGNSLVILTLVQSKRMRTVTNVFLLNLAVSDILLGVFCMPVTLIGGLLRNFIFGWTLCKLIPYLQAVSVSVSVWTLVSISLERFFAICQPLESRRWQTISHSYNVIAFVWILSLVATIPIAYMSQLLSVCGTGRKKCREVWPDIIWERTFNIYIGILLFLIPLIIMTITYSLICITLCREIQIDNKVGCIANKQLSCHSIANDRKTIEVQAANGRQVVSSIQTKSIFGKPCYHSRPPSRKSLVFRRNHQNTNNSKQRIIRMLFVLVLEFFVCWTPLYTLHTLSLFVESFYAAVPVEVMAGVHLLSYVSSCCNPITYCFMHGKYRREFKKLLRFRYRKRYCSHKSSSAFDRSISKNSSTPSGRDTVDGFSYSSRGQSSPFFTRLNQQRKMPRATGHCISNVLNTPKRFAILIRTM